MRLPSNFLRPSFPSFSSISSPTRWNSQQLALDICQRLPPISQLFILVLVIWGPFYTPVLFGTLIVIVHVAFVSSTLRTAYGMRVACKAVEECASTDWRAVSRSTTDFDRVKHLIILPNYKETLDTLRETLFVLASHPNAHQSYRVVLACEMAETGVTDKVNILIEEFSTAFFEISCTLHPRDIEGEAAGKSSNVAWATREINRRNSSYMMEQIITVMDADSCFASDFFAACASKFVSASPSTRRNLMFVAPIFFDRNASHAAAPVVIADILWCAAGLGTMYSGSRAKLPTSAYAMSNQLASRIGYWDAGPEAIGEDLHMAVKAWFETAGELHVEAIYSPASQCNVVGFRYPRVTITGSNGEETEASLRPYQYVYEYCSDVSARYAQAKRHMWGALDSGYALRRIALQQFGPGTDLLNRHQHHSGSTSQDLEDGLRTVSLRLDTLGNKTIPTFSYSASATSPFSPLPGLDMTATPASEMSESDFTSFASTEDGESDDGAPASSPPSSNSTSPLLRPTDIKSEPVSPVFLEQSASTNTLPAKFPLFNFIVLLTRLYEAHFNLGYLFMFLSVGPYFNPGLEPTALWKLRASGEVIKQSADLIPRAALVGTDIAAQLGTLAFLGTIGIFYYYEHFHHMTTTKRWEGRPHLGARAYQQTIRTMPQSLFIFAGLPFAPFFGIIPLYHAQISHLYSNRLTYQVSAKPVAINRASGTTSRNSPSTSHSNSSINLVALNEKSATSSSRLTV